MKTFTFLLLGLCLSLPVLAQEKSDVPQLTSEELDKLVAPIALYPDSLIALILPASTDVADVVLAARYIANGGDPEAIDNQSWSDSVKSLARFPDLVAWMDENLAWTQQMGDVFEAQPADVMNAIQRLRAQAREAGLLTDTPQQKVVMQEQVICIVPAEPDVIYVPRYDPEYLWLRRPYHGPFLTFGLGFGIGNWLYFDCDWFGHGIWMQNRHSGWAYRPAWRRPSSEVHVVLGAPWRPDFRHEHRARPEHRPVSVAVRPTIMRDPRPDNHSRPANIGRPGFDGRSDHGDRPDNRGDRSDNRGDRPGRPERSGPQPAHVNRSNTPVPPSHAVSPTAPAVTQSPSAPDRPPYRPNVGSPTQAPREGPRINRGVGDSSSVYAPRSSAPVTPAVTAPRPAPTPSAPPPQAVERPQNHPSPSSGSAAPSSRESPRFNRGSEGSAAQYTPRPPSHYPPAYATPSAPPPPPPPPAAAPRPSRSESSSSVAPSAAPSGNRSAPAPQPASQEKKESDDQRQARERGGQGRRQ